MYTLVDKPKRVPHIKADKLSASRNRRAKQSPAVYSILHSHPESSPLPLQAKSGISAPGDVYEQEADRAAESVMQTPDSAVEQYSQDNDQQQSKAVRSHIIPGIQRQSEPDEEEEEEATLQDTNLETSDSEITTHTSPIIDSVQSEDAAALEDVAGPEELQDELIQTKQNTAHTSQSTAAISQSIDAVRSGGQPLPAAERNFFEPRFGADFSHVRIHTSKQAARSSDTLNAQAYTIGSNIAFADGKFSPGSYSGRKLLAHELTHVIQQAPRIQRSLPAKQHSVTRTYPQVMLRRNRKRKSTTTKCDDARRHHILKTAFARKNTPNIAKSYRSTNPWVFCPDSEHKNSWSLLQINLADKLLDSRKRTRRRLSRIKQPEERKFVRDTIKAATRLLPPYWMKKQMTRKMRSLGKSLENYPAGENVVWWGDKINKCNLWVFDVLYKAGYNFLTADKAQPTLDLMWGQKVRGLKRIYSIYSVKPGDIFVASWNHTGFVYKNYGSQFIGLEYLGRKGIGVKTHKKIKTTFSNDFKFFCVTK